MMMVPINWCFQRKSIMPIIEAKGESTVKESKKFLIQNAIEIIEEADKFKGRPYPSEPNFPTTNSISVSFSLIFPTETDIKNFMEFLQQKNK